MGAPGKLIGVLGLAQGWSSQELLRAVAERAGSAELLDPLGLELDLASGRAACHGRDLMGFDAIMVKKLGHNHSPRMLDRLEILRLAQAGGLPIFAAPQAMARVINRLSCTVALRLGGIPMPRTAVCQSAQAGARALRRLGPCLAKPLYSSKAWGMRVITPGPDATAQLRDFQAQGNPTLYLQQWLDLPDRDLGVVFLGGKYLCTYARSARSFGARQSDPPVGGKYAPCEPTPEVIALASRAQALIGLDFTCVDVVETRQGPLVLEVSAFGGFRGIKVAHGLDAAGLYVDYVLGKLGG